MHWAGEFFRRYGRPGVTAWAAASFGVAALSLAAALLPLLDPINDGAPVWLLASALGLPFALFALKPRRPWLVAAFAAAACVETAIVAPEFAQSAPRAEASAGPTVRIVWLNAWDEDYVKPRTLRYLLNVNADFLLLTEFTEKADTPEALLRLYPYFIPCSLEEDCTTIILSRRRPKEIPPSLSIATDVELRLAMADFDIDGAPLRLMAAHLARPPRLIRRQALQLSALALEVAHASPPDDVILAADFNSTPWSFALRRFDKRTGLARHTRAMPTWPAQEWTRLRLPAPAPFMPIDHVYSGKAWRLVAIRRGPRTDSDHYPLEAELTAAAPP